MMKSGDVEASSMSNIGTRHQSRSVGHRSYEAGSDKQRSAAVWTETEGLHIARRT